MVATMEEILDTTLEPILDTIPTLEQLVGTMVATPEEILDTIPTLVSTKEEIPDTIPTLDTMLTKEVILGSIQVPPWLLPVVPLDSTAWVDLQQHLVECQHTFTKRQPRCLYWWQQTDLHRGYDPCRRSFWWQSWRLQRIQRRENRRIQQVFKHPEEEANNLFWLN